MTSINSIEWHHVLTSLRIGLIGVLFLTSTLLFSQKSRTQYPPFLSNSFFSINIGHIQYPFSQAQLLPGFQAESIKVYHAAARVNLGHQFNDHWSAQINYIRPFEWTKYNNVNGDQIKHSVWMNLAAISARYRTPLVGKLNVYGEAGVVIVTRGGFDGWEVKVADVTYTSILLGAGLQYNLASHWDLLASVAYSPKNDGAVQPSTTMISGGFAYYFRPLTEDKVEISNASKYSFKRDLFQVAYTTNAFGFGANALFSQEKGRFGIPIFWHGKALIRDGITLAYQRNLYHGRKVFSFNLGASTSYLWSEQSDDGVFTLAVYPVVRFWFLRKNKVDLYANYSVAGPAYISKRFIDGEDTGGKFTFQDFMGVGGMLGDKKQINFEVKIVHYSNGNVLPQNRGVAVPLTFSLGYGF